MSNGEFNPEISEAFTVAPEVVYSPIVPLPSFATNRFDPDTAMPIGSFNPEISEAFTVAPEVVYSPIVPLSSVHDKQIRSRHRDADRAIQPRDQRGVHRRPRGGVFANRAVAKVRDKQIRSRHRDASRAIQPRDQRGVHRRPRGGVFANRAVCRQRSRQTDSLQTPRCHRGPLNPEISEAFTVAPEVVYSPIVPLPLFATNKIRSGHRDAERVSTPRSARRSPSPLRWCIRRPFRCRY